MESHEENFFLLLDHDSKPLLFLFHVQNKLIILFLSFFLLHIASLLLELLDSYDVSFDFVLNDLDSGVTHLISYQKLVELTEVTICLKYIKQV